MSGPLTQPQLDQLKVLLDMGAADEARAVDRHTASWQTERLNMVMLGGVLFSRGLVNRVEKPARYGMPKRRLYYLSVHGKTVLEQRGA
jgi:hypothetical protein